MKNTLWLLATTFLFALSAHALPSGYRDESPPSYDAVQRFAMPARSADVHLVGNEGQASLQVGNEEQASLQVGNAERVEDTEEDMWHDTSAFPLNEEVPHLPREHEVAVGGRSASQDLLHKIASINYIRAHILLTLSGLLINNIDEASPAAKYVYGLSGLMFLFNAYNFESVILPALGDDVLPILNILMKLVLMTLSLLGLTYFDMPMVAKVPLQLSVFGEAAVRMYYRPSVEQESRERERVRRFDEEHILAPQMQHQMQPQLQSEMEMQPEMEKVSNENLVEEKSKQDEVDEEVAFYAKKEAEARHERPTARKRVRNYPALNQISSAFNALKNIGAAEPSHAERVGAQLAAAPVAPRHVPTRIEELDDDDVEEKEAILAE